jgi:YD repeat-containing protein
MSLQEGKKVTSADSGSTIARFDYGYHPHTNNIKWQMYDHMTNPQDPCVVFNYDNLDRLKGVVYNTDSTDEGFTIDDLGNRSSVNPRSGSNISYIMNNTSNRYDNIDGHNLAYDYAGNLTIDKDGYGYEYDYENRIVKITKSGQTKAEFAYDALGRRIEVKDCVDNTKTRRFYYDNDWRVLWNMMVQITLKRRMHTVITWMKYCSATIMQHQHIIFTFMIICIVQLRYSITAAQWSKDMNTMPMESGISWMLRMAIGLYRAMATGLALQAGKWMHLTMEP